MSRDAIALITAIILGGGWQWWAHWEPYINRPPWSYVNGVSWILAGVVVRALLGERMSFEIPLLDLFLIVAGNGIFVFFSYIRQGIQERMTGAMERGAEIARR